MDGNVGCMYFLFWEEHTTEHWIQILWTSNIDKPLEDMYEDELEEQMELIFRQEVSTIVSDPDNWEMRSGIETYENIGWD